VEEMTRYRIPRAPAFAGQSTKELWVHPCDHHPNGRPQAIAERLERDASGFLNP